MLILTRRCEQTITITPIAECDIILRGEPCEGTIDSAKLVKPEPIVVRVLEIRHGSVRLGITAPLEYKIERDDMKNPNPKPRKPKES